MLDSAGPRVSVVMSVYNGEKYLAQAIESILSQTFRDFEFIIVDDGSTDGTAGILSHYQQQDTRIHVLSHENQGVVASANTGCKMARGKYIARMDADDVSLPDRLALQVEYMETNPQIGVLGTLNKYYDEKGKFVKIWPEHFLPGTIRWVLLFEDCIANPSVLMRRELIEKMGFYSPDAVHAEDYDLWTRASPDFQMANLKKICMKRRICSTGISLQYSQIQRKNAGLASHNAICRFLGEPVLAETTACLQAGIKRPRARAPSIDLLAIESACELVQRIHHLYVKTQPLDREEAKQVARDAGIRLLKLAVLASGVSLRKAVVIFTQAVAMSPRALSPPLFFKGLRALLRSRNR